MSKIDVVRSDMMAAMKAGEKEKKNALSALLTALKNAAIDKRSDLTQEEEDSVVLKEIKVLKESIDSSPADRTEFIEDCQFRIDVMQAYAPVFMSEDEIKATIQGVLDELGITTPAAKDKGNIMKNLMPKVKGKADSALVNQMVSKLFA
ncbi:MAG TPA: GatB/YqeY domain-containing protein [Lachnospiraceae bacterium]|uniref:GatB/YqeY domain-containing protein n=1 Tax=Anaerosporobacter sp. TaxID=1872529 RepID=UPI000EC98A34|nr:GatB/YqeY domain-containing protein [Anaerosporobacter sp.]MBS5934267.1 GatB/YqeY domain-containing protein [Clostridiales bacterium]HAB61917.1 GatB/YqeY domain-containing protein [Lachnospiraceae bacterium]